VAPAGGGGGFLEEGDFGELEGLMEGGREGGREGGMANVKMIETHFLITILTCVDRETTHASTPSILPTSRSILPEQAAQDMP